MNSSPRTVYFVSLGCPKNLVDSQVMLGKLDTGPFRRVGQAEEADVIIVNTCAFIEAAKKESVETILEMAELKTEGQCRALVVSGCLAQRYFTDLEKEIPEIDLLIGTGQYHRVVELLDLLDRKENESRSYVDQPAFIHTDQDSRVMTGPGHSAFLKISEGCNRRCSFCIIPKLRGHVRSRSIASLVKEAEGMAEQGVRELCLVAQDLTEYGMEGKYRENLALLLPELCKVDVDWIRLHYVYPEDFSDELIEVIASQSKIVKYLDMPIQHTNDRVLSAMNRKLRKKRLFELVRKLRERVPGIVFRTSIIVGFPSETEEEFQELCNDLETLKLDHVGVFSYSNEEGTKAALMEGQLSDEVKRERTRRLISLLQKQAWNLKKNYIGQVVPVLVEGASSESEHLLQGRMATQAAEIDGGVLINDLQGFDRSEIRSGQMIRVEITEAHPQDLVGRVHSFA